MTPLHQIGDFLRQLLLLIPLGAARAIFLAVLVALLIWVLLLPAHATRPPSEAQPRWSENLRIWAGLALLFQIAVYAWL